MQTTVVHIVIERLKLKGVLYTFPKEIQGDLVKEHDYALREFNLMEEHGALFDNVCKEIDYAIADGVVVFDGESGVVTILGST